jgi:hypothetical protein
VSRRSWSARRRLAILALAALPAGGCAADRWPDYDASLYRRLKENSAASVQDHLALLKQIIDRSEARGERPPPGVYAEYGYGLAAAGNLEGGLVFLDRETASYPESQTFVVVLKRVVAGDRKVFERAPSAKAPLARDGARP